MILTYNILKKAHVHILNIQKNSSVAIRLNKIEPDTFTLFALCDYVLSDLTAIHYPTKNLSLTIVYIYTIFKKQMLLTSLIKNHSNVHTASLDYRSAIVAERECYEMFGVFFEKHEDLRKLLLDYNANYNPLLKSFPVTGYSQISYTVKKHIVFVPLVLMQELRVFNFNQVWIETA